MRGVGNDRCCHPVGGHHLPAVPLAAAPVQLAEFGEVAGGQVQPAEGQLATVRVEQPVAVVLHAEGLVQVLLHEVGDRPAGRTHEQGAQRLGVGGVVLAHRAGSDVGRRRRDEPVEATTPGCHGRTQTGDVGGGVAVVLVPACTRRHLQHVLDPHAVVGRAGVDVDVVADRIVDRADVAVLHGDADQRRHEALGHRPRDPLHVRPAGQPVLLVYHCAVAQDEQRSGVGDVEELLGVDGGAVEIERRGEFDRVAVGEAVRCRAGGECAARDHPVQAVEVLVLRRSGEQPDGREGRRGL